LRYGDFLSPNNKNNVGPKTIVHEKFVEGSSSRHVLETKRHDKQGLPLLPSSIDRFYSHPLDNYE